MRAESSARLKKPFSKKTFVRAAGGTAARSGSLSIGSPLGRRVIAAMSPTSSQAERWLMKAGNSSGGSRDRDDRRERSRAPPREPDSVMSSRSVRSADPEASFRHAENMMGQTTRGFTPPSDHNRRSREREAYSRYDDNVENEVRDAGSPRRLPRVASFFHVVSRISLVFWSPNFEGTTTPLHDASFLPRGRMPGWMARAAPLP